jgi:hypothetical protein
MAQFDWDRRWDREHGRDSEERRRRELDEGWRERERDFREGGEQRDRFTQGPGREQEREGWGERGEDWRRRQPWSGENRTEIGRDREYPSRSDWGAQGRWGSYGNRSADWSEERWEPGRDRDWNRGNQERRNDEWLRSYGHGTSYGGGLGGSQEMGRFAGRGPKNWHRSDERIREDVNERLTDHPDIDASEIEVQVKNGEVTLAGTLNDRHSKRLAEEVAERVSGVKEVHNQVRIQTTAQTGSSLNR